MNGFDRNNSDAKDSQIKAMLLLRMRQSPRIMLEQFVGAALVAVVGWESAHLGASPGAIALRMLAAGAFSIPAVRVVEYLVPVMHALGQWLKKWEYTGDAAGLLGVSFFVLALVPTLKLSASLYETIVAIAGFATIAFLRRIKS